MTLKPTVTGNKLSAQTLDSTQHYYDTSLAIEPASLQYLLLELDQNKLKSCAYHLTKNKVVGFSILPLVGIENNLSKTLKSESKLNQDFEQTILSIRTNNYTLVPRTYLGNDFETVFKLTNSFDTEHEVLLNHPMVNLRANVLYAIPKKEHEAIKSSFSRLALIPHIAPRIEHQLNHNSRSKGDRMVIHSNGDWLDILVFKDHELILSNCFYIASKEDVAYYTLFCAEALQLDTEAHLMIISGAIKAKDETHDLLSKYWQNIEPASLLHNATVSDHFPSYPTTELDYLTQSLVVRVIGGTLKGRRFLAPKQIPARPTTDYAKESLFNILGNRIVWGETSFLDLFSGIGSISLEAISRGAQQVTSVDTSFAAIKWYQQLQREFEIKNWQALKQDAFKWLKQNDKQFDLVFADPPYDSPFYNELIEQIISTKLTDEGLFVLEHRKSDSFASHPHFESERHYGEVKFTFFTKEN